MENHAVPDTIPISALNALEYCPRRFYYQFVQADMLINEFVLEGALLHRRVHQAGMRTMEGLPQTTRLYLYSETLHLSGFTDVIEERNGLPIQARQTGHLAQRRRPALCASTLPGGTPHRLSQYSQ